MRCVRIIAISSLALLSLTSGAAAVEEHHEATETSPSSLEQQSDGQQVTPTTSPQATEQPGLAQPGMTAWPRMGMVNRCATAMGRAGMMAYGMEMMGHALSLMGSAMTMMGPGMGMMSPDMDVMRPGAMGMMGEGMGDLGMMGGPGAVANLPAAGIGERLEGRLAFLRAELAIAEAQVPQWNAFAEALRVYSKAMKSLRTAMMQASTPPQTLAARLDEQERMLAARLEGVRTLRTAVQALAAALDDAQTKAFEEIVPMQFGLHGL